MKILVAEDEPDLLHFYKIFLEGIGHGVTATVDGQEALDEYHKEIDQGGRFDLVILDYRMPRKNGVEVADEITKIAPSQPLLLITAYAGVIDFKNLKVIPKPFDPDELLKLINVMVKE
jgi:two-component system cell cycle response regulator CpdR